MAKARRNRAKANRSDPLTKPKEIKPPSDPELAALREKRILPIVKDLQSPEPKKRGEAATAISNIIDNEKCRKLLLREQIVDIVLTETLTDASLEGRAAGWEILKTLAQHEGPDFSVHLHRSDVLTAVKHSVEQGLGIVLTRNSQTPQATKIEQRFAWEIFMSITSLLNDLATAGDEILEAIVSNTTIMQFLFTLIKSTQTPEYLLENVLTCLITLSEDNRDLAEMIVRDEGNESGAFNFPKLFESKLAGAKGALVCGLLHNIFSVLEWYDHSPGLNGASDAIIIPRLCQILDGRMASTTKERGMDHNEIAQLVCDILASIGSELQASLEKGNRDSKSEAQKQEAEEWNGFDEPMDGTNGKHAKAERNGADSDHEMGDEAEEEDGEGEDDEEAEDDDEMDDDAILADMDIVTGADDAVHDDSSSGDLPKTLDALIRKAVPELISVIRLPVSDEVSLAIQMSALSALNNIAWSISCIDFTEEENGAVAAVWVPTARNIWSKVVTPILAEDTADIKLATMVTSLAWALARTVGGDASTAAVEVRKFMALYKASSSLGKDGLSEGDDDPFQSLGVKCVGVLGQMAKNQDDMELNRQVGVFLVSILAALPKTAAAEVVEALDQLFDLYGDENKACDKEVFWKDGFLTHLEAARPKIRTAAKGIDKRKNEELRTRIDEALLNLDRFLKYKRKNAPK